MLVATAFVSLAMRYPGSHEIGVDSFAIHTLAQSIVASGRAVWTLNPFSYFGWFPASYPSAGPFMLSSIAALSQVNMEGTILLTSLMFGLVGIGTSFLMALEFNREKYFAIGVSFVYSLAPRFLDFTLWQASTRDVFMALFPVFIWAVLRFYKRRTFANAALLSVSFFILAASHRLVVLAIVVAAVFLVTVVVSVAYQVVKRTHPASVMRTSQLGITRWGVLASILGVSLGFMMWANVLPQYSTGELANGSSVPVEILNLGVSITRSVGVAAPLAIIGLLYSPWVRSPGVGQAFAVMSLIALVPTLLLRDYTGFYILPFLALFSVYGVVAISQRLASRPQLRRGFCVVVAAGIVVAAGAILSYEKTQSPPLSPTTYGAATYLQYSTDGGTVVCNEAVTCSRLAAIGSLIMIPTAAGSPDRPSPEVLVFGFFTGDDIARNVVLLPLADLGFNSDSLWAVVGVNPSGDYARIIQSPVNGVPQALMHHYNISYYLEISDSMGGYIDDQGNRLQSPLGISAASSSYVLYSDGAERVFWIG